MIFDVVINGIATCGKDTFISLLDHSESGLMVNNFSSIDPFRNMPKQFGWSGEKDDDYRMCLKTLKKASTYMNDYPSRYLEFQRNQILEKYEGLFQDVIFFYHIREPEEIDKFKKRIPTAKTVLVEKTGIRIPESEECVLNYKYDYIVENNLDLKTLKDSAITLLEGLRGRYWTQEEYYDK